MSSVLSAIWPFLSSYRPNAARDRQCALFIVFWDVADFRYALPRAQREKQPLRFGAFEATYKPPGFGIRSPRNDDEAQR